MKSALAIQFSLDALAKRAYIYLNFHYSELNMIKQCWKQVMHTYLKSEIVEYDIEEILKEAVYGLADIK